MKIIDILNKMANGELEDGFKFCFKDEIYTYTKSDNSIRDINSSKLGQRKAIETYLNEEVMLFKDNNQDIIEENKKIEELNKISYDEFVYTDNKHRFDLTTIEYDKINELIRAVNKINKGREEK